MVATDTPNDGYVRARCTKECSEMHTFELPCEQAILPGPSDEAPAPACDGRGHQVGTSSTD